MVRPDTVCHCWLQVIAAANMSALPVVTGEIGDSWLYGGGADPIKVSVFREARRALKAGVAAGAINPWSAGYPNGSGEVKIECGNFS